MTASVKAPEPSEIQQHIDAIARQGFTILEGAISAELQSDLIAELQRLESVRPGGDIPPGPFTGYVTRRWFDLLNDAPVWQQVAIHPGVLAVLVKILGDGFLLSTLGWLFPRAIPGTTIQYPARPTSRSLWSCRPEASPSY